MSHLVVVEPFGGHQRGDAIRDEQEMAEVLAGENQHSVVRVADQPAAEPAKQGA